MLLGYTESKHQLNLHGDPWGQIVRECGCGPVAPISEVIACQSRWELVLSVAWTLHLKKSIDVGDINT